jgi:hypothetical protein
MNSKIYEGPTGFGNVIGSNAMKVTPNSKHIPTIGAPTAIVRRKKAKRKSKSDSSPPSFKKIKTSHKMSNSAQKTINSHKLAFKNSKSKKKVKLPHKSTIALDKPQKNKLPDIF